MKILKLLNKNFYFILLYLFFGLNSSAEEQPADIWNIDKKKIEDNNQNKDLNSEIEKQFKKNKEIGIYNMQSQNNKSIIKLEQTLETQEIKRKSGFFGNDGIWKEFYRFIDSKET